MSYRKINVSGQTYEYVVGKNFLKIKGVGVYSKSSIGISYGKVRDDKWEVTPSIITDLILTYQILNK